MRLFEKNFSNWWLLPFFAVCIAASPFALIFMFGLSHVIGGMIGPPSYWERPRHTPPRGDLVGSYKEVERTWIHKKIGPDATLSLNDDGSMSVNNLPDDSITSNCTLSGTGSWSGPYNKDGDQLIDLSVVTTNAGANTCPPGGYSLIELIGRKKPYGIYWVLGDPDSGEGVRLKRQ